MLTSLALTRRRRLSMTILSAVALIAWTALADAAGPVPIVRAAPASASAADYVPDLGEIPGYRLEDNNAAGGDLEPVVALRRTYVSLDGVKHLVIDVAVGTSPSNAQQMTDENVNRLVRYEGWRMRPGGGFGDSSYVGDWTVPTGRGGAATVFRLKSVATSVEMRTDEGPADVGLVNNLARLVEMRIRAVPDLVVYQPGWPVTPVTVPGKEPPGAPIEGYGTGTEILGASGLPTIAGDTMVILTVTGVDRPWRSTLSRSPAPNMDFLTVNLQIDVAGPTSVVVALTDFFLATQDGRQFTATLNRSPELTTGQIATGIPARGWLTFEVPTSQPAIQLIWRLRSTQALADQGGGDQAMVVPLTAGASTTASIGTNAPPNSFPIVPPSAAPPGGGGNSGGGSSGGGGSGSSRNGTRLQ